MAEDPRGQTWLVSAAGMMLVDGWSLIQERSVKLSLALAVLFCLPTLSRTATAQPSPANARVKQSPTAGLRRSKPCREMRACCVM